MPPKTKPIERQIPLAPVGRDRGGKEADNPSGITDGSEKIDVIESAELDLGPSLSGVENDMRTLTHSDLERESRGESPLKNDGAGPSTTSNPSVTRSSRLTARRVPTTLNEAGSSSHAECLPPVLGEKDGVPMFRVVSKLRLVKERIKELNRNMGCISEGVSRMRLALKEYQKNGPFAVPHLGINKEESLLVDYQGCLTDMIPLEAGVSDDAVDCCIAGWFGGRSDLCFDLWVELLCA
ncbi:hypothetical protein Nepgr_018782 [Nepenthes gracilis]|uniref:Uncharacterized protein n=1 Tax=Nepenthes gracilis TaxID=150966 RepID=A0AAD3SVV3_NEPGR|nr:hypothetical protein Nepgr_018782 [Nepenthes gracilis]